MPALHQVGVIVPESESQVQRLYLELANIERLHFPANDRIHYCHLNPLEEEKPFINAVT